MQISFEINDDQIKGFTPEAQKALHDASEKIVNELIDEACRLERGRRIGETAEITESDVKQAAIVRPVKRPRKNKTDLFLQGFCPVLAAVPGFVFNLIKVPWSILLTVFCLVSASIITVYLMMKEDNNG